MYVVIFTLLGFVAGGLAMMVALDVKRKRVNKLKEETERSAEELRTNQNQFAAEMQQERDSRSQQLQERFQRLRASEIKLKEELQQEREVHSRQVQERLEKIRAYEANLKEQVDAFNAAKGQFESRVVTYKNLQDENSILKRDLRNLAVGMRKLELDRTVQQQSQSELAQKVEEIGSRYLKENVKWISNALNANNFATCRQRLVDVIERCRGIGFKISEEEESLYVAELKAEYEKEVRAAFEREEQARIKAQIREEQKVEREIKREQERIAREKMIVETALAKALASAADQHSSEIESLKAQLAEAEAKERAISQAQLTKAGFVYVISNIGSFGEDVFKIGMTRRLEPLERVRELGDASVPFPFDVHMMISCHDAPALENALHKSLLKQQLNKTNPKKEFFKIDIETIVSLVKANHGEIEYVADPEALQYRQSLSMSDEDLEFIEHVFDEIDDDGEAVEDITTPVKLPAEISIEEN